MIKLTIDGRPVEVEEGTKLFDAITTAGKELPAMCYHYTFDPFGSCGVCLVTVEGKKAPVRACTAKVTPDMVVTTESMLLFEARKKAVEKHLSVHPLDCPVCDADGHCELQDNAYAFGISDVKEVKQKGIPEDTRSLVLDFNMNRCILCAQCINVCKEVQMVDALQFLKKEGNTHVVAKEDRALFCEFCGDCLAVCPVGAITNKFSKYIYKPWQIEKTMTTCPHCATGCQIQTEVIDNKVVRVTSLLSWKDKFWTGKEEDGWHGGLCVRGRFGFKYQNSPDLLTAPLLRDGEDLKPVSWLEAIDFASSRLAEIVTKHGPGAVAGAITGRCTNEDLYAFQKFFRAILGSPNVDSVIRYGHINDVLAMQKVGGAGGLMNSYVEIAQSDYILMIGNDMNLIHPVAALQINHAVDQKATLVVADPRKTKLAQLATRHIAIRPGFDRTFTVGILKAVMEGGKVAENVRNVHSGATARIAAAAGSISFDDIEKATGIPRAEFSKIAEELAAARRPVVIAGEEVTGAADGYEHVHALLDLAIVAGLFSKEGAGINFQCDEANEQGAADMGVAPELAPGAAGTNLEARRDVLSRAWKRTFPREGGLTFPEALVKARTGEIKALYLVGENPLETLPKSARVREALSNLDLLIVQDPFLTEAGKMAHVVLPAAIGVEKSGAYTDMEGKIQPVSFAKDPHDERHDDWAIFTEISGRIGQPLLYRESRDISEEIHRLIPGYKVGRMHEKPAYEIGPYLESLTDGELKLRYHIPLPAPRPEFPVRIQLEPILYHAGKTTTRDEGLMRIVPAGRLQLHPDDAASLNVVTGHRVRLSSPFGTVDVECEVNERTAKGTVVFPDHFSDPPVKDLLGYSISPATSIPVFRIGYARLEKVPGQADLPTERGPEDVRVPVSIVVKAPPPKPAAKPAAAAAKPAATPAAKPSPPTSESEGNGEGSPLSAAASTGADPKAPAGPKEVS